MENQRLIALALAFIAFLLVIMAGRSCAKDIQETNQSSTTENIAANSGGNNNFNNNNEGYAIAERTTAELNSNPTETQSVYIEEVTNMFGTVKETVIHTLEPETETVRTTSSSILEQYWAEQHEKQSEKQKEKESKQADEDEDYTLPSSVHITIN